MIQIIGAEHTREYHWLVYNYLLQQNASTLLWHLPTAVHMNPQYLKELMSSPRDEPIRQAVSKLGLDFYCYEDLEAYNSFLRREEFVSNVGGFVEDASKYPGFQRYQEILMRLPNSVIFRELTRPLINLARDIRSAKNIRGYSNSYLERKTHVYAGLAHVTLKTELDETHHPTEFVILDPDVPAYVDDELTYRIVGNRIDENSVVELIERAHVHGTNSSRMSIKELIEEMFPNWVLKGEVVFPQIHIKPRQK